MGMGTAHALMVAVVLQGPPTGELCRIEYEEVVGSGTAVRTTPVNPSETKAVGDVVLRIVNKESRPLEARLLPPAGPPRTVTLQGFGATDPPVLQYVGNWTLQSVHCPSAYPSAPHMWGTGEPLEAVRREFQLSVEDAAVLIRNDYDDVEALQHDRGALQELMSAFPEYAWSASSAANLLHTTQYPASAAVHGLLRNDLVSAGDFRGEMGQAMAVTRQAGYSVADVLEGSRRAVRTLQYWNAPVYETWLDAMPAQTRYLLEAGFAYADIAPALTAVYAPSVDDFVGAFFYQAWHARGSDASGRTAKALQATFGLDEVGVARALLDRAMTADLPGGPAQPSWAPPYWEGSRGELRDGLYASALQGCAWLGRAVLEKWSDRPLPVNATPQQVQSMRATWNRVPDDDLDEVLADVQGDLPATAECLLGASFGPARILAYADARVPTPDHRRLAPGFRSFGIQCGPLIDLLMASDRGTGEVWGWLREAAYPDMEGCLDVLSARTGTFLMDYYVADLGPAVAARAARRHGWVFAETADAMDWFRAPEPRFGAVVDAYRVSADAALRYLRSFARDQGRETVFDYGRYLLEAFDPRAACDAVTGAEWSPHRAPECRSGRGGR